MLQNHSKELTLIVYNSPKAPRQFKIRKSLLKTLSVLVPFLVFFSVSYAIFVTFYMKDKVKSIKSSKPKEVQSLLLTNQQLQDEVLKLEAGNKDLLEKVAAGVSSESLIFNLFATPLGFQDLRSENLAKIENISNRVSNNKVEFKFDLLNNGNDVRRLSGFITVLQYHSSGVNIYPTVTFNQDNPYITYNSGESFNVSRFRPVIAQFPIPFSSAKYWYKIFIFSKTGNLLSMKTTQEYLNN